MTVITFGSFDLFHIGHVQILKRAKNLGDHLVVGVSSNTCYQNKKGVPPIYDERSRMAIIESIRWVDETFYEESLEQKEEYIKRYKADILVMGNDWAGQFDHLKTICEVVYLERTQGISSTQIKEILSRI